ncbi:hypothetical protein F5B22DRAFT_352426 [Xylaria bambusicola]|uniref:uncharacterized protein n=1 Tax=Xylaria bambusicola TaxID=326684 RepID=UPI0020079CDC|nr:uncharacterized protein F5B22DRAFT_352426 [Xylaria bambusicola]KAI0525626.1 hypothetical protein F5B22DRAFT_352426 [Xylaria bambusicola]
MTVLPPDPYRILGVSKDAQIPEIRSAHRKLVLKCHPDKIQDPALKEAKQKEFQQVQQAYELLSNEVEREKYDRKAEAFELRERERERAKTSAARTTSSTPKRESPLFYHVKEASPRTTTFAKSSPYGRTPPRSWEDTTSAARLFEEATRHARKTASYEKEKPSRREEERRRRKEEEEWAREKEKAKERELREVREAREAREARKARERKEEKERVARDREDREKEKRKEEKKKAHSDREKEREKERKNATAEKHRSRGHPIIEDQDSSDVPDSSEDDDVVYEPPPSKTDRKKSGSSRKPEDIDGPSTERTRKYSGNMESAIRYLTKAGTKPVSFGRSHTYTEGSSMLYNPMVPTPPPAAGAPFAPPPPTNEPEEISEEEVRRSAARPSGRRMSHDTPRTSREKSSSHKKSSSSRDQPIIVEAGSPRTVPSLPRAHTESFSRPIPVPNLSRAETWYPSTEREHERHERGRSRLTPPAYTDEEDTEEDRERRHRRSRRTQSPEPIPHVRYGVDGSGTKSIPIRQKQYHEQPPRGSYKTNKAYVMPNSSARVQRGHTAYARDYYEEDRPQHFPGIKYAPQFKEQDIRYSDLPYKGSSYRPDVYA